MKLKLHYSALLVLLLSPFALPALAVDPPAAEKKPPAATDAKKPEPNHVLVTISKETSAITKPLRKDGYPDYVAALNEIYGKDITPENNAVVLFWKALGPAMIEPQYRADYFRLLETPIPADKGNYFVGLDEFFRQHNPANEPGNASRLTTELSKIDDQLELACRRPWSSKEFPVLAAWLAANTHALDLVVEASHRPRYFDPLVGGGNTLLIALLPARCAAQRGVAGSYRKSKVANGTRKHGRRVAGIIGGSSFGPPVWARAVLDPCSGGRDHRRNSLPGRSSPIATLATFRHRRLANARRFGQTRPAAENGRKG